MESTIITPGREARQLFSRMVARADDNLIISLDSTLALCADRINQGCQPQAAQEVTELVDQGWIGPHQGGGWILYEGVFFN